MILNMRSIYFGLVIFFLLLSFSIFCYTTDKYIKTFESNILFQNTHVTTVCEYHISIILKSPKEGIIKNENKKVPCYYSTGFTDNNTFAEFAETLVLDKLELSNSWYLHLIFIFAFLFVLFAILLGYLMARRDEIDDSDLEICE